MDYGFFSDGQEPTPKGDQRDHQGSQYVLSGESQAEHDDLEHACPMQRCGGPGSNQGNSRVVEQTWLPGRPDNEPATLAFRDAVIREMEERFGVRVIAQAPTKYDSASAGMVENAIKHVKEKVRTLVNATRELRGVVMDPEHVALAWCVRFAGQVISRTLKGADGLTVFQRAFQRTPHPRTMPSAWREEILYLESSKRKIQITDNFSNGIFLGIKEGSEEFVVETLVSCVACKTVKKTAS